MNQQTKICTKCGEEKLLAEYSKGRGKFWRESQCKLCKHKYYINNREYIKEKSRKYYKENIEACKEKRKLYWVEYSKNNRERLNMKWKLWEERNKEYCKNKTKEYRENHREYYRNLSKEHYEKNKDVLLEKAREHYRKGRDELSDVYVIKLFTGNGSELLSNDVKKYPELIEAKRLEVKIKRAFRT